MTHCSKLYHGYIGLNMHYSENGQYIPEVNNLDSHLSQCEVLNGSDLVF